MQKNSWTVSFRNETEWLRNIADEMNATIIDHQVVIPENLGRGFFAARRMEKGLSVRYIEITFLENLEYRRRAAKRKDQITLSFQFQDMEYSDQPGGPPDSFFKLNKGSIVVFSSNTHTSVRIPANKAFSVFTVDMSLSWLEERLGSFLVKDPEVNQVIFSEEKIVYFEPMKYRYFPVFKEIFASELDPAIAPLMLHAKTEELVYLFFDQLYRNRHRKVAPAQNITADDQHRIHDLLKYIEEHPDASLDLESLSRMAGFSRSKLQRLFHHIVGQSVYAYIKRMKMETAADRLKNTDESVTQVAFSVGYHSDTHFINAFRKHFGISPKQFRIRMRKEG